MALDWLLPTSCSASRFSPFRLIPQPEIQYDSIHLSRFLVSSIRLQSSDHRTTDLFDRYDR
jgi:hypothetical protein